LLIFMDAAGTRRTTFPDFLRAGSPHARFYLLPREYKCFLVFFRRQGASSGPHPLQTNTGSSGRPRMYLKLLLCGTEPGFQEVSRVLSVRHLKRLQVLTGSEMLSEALKYHLSQRGSPVRPHGNRTEYYFMESM
jgi:hypothetical protein